MLIYRLLGFLFLGLGFIGAFLPLLPTTPFILVAAGCFARSSPRMHAWLLANRTFGPMICNWQAHQCISCRAQRVALLSVLLFGGYSVAFALSAPYMIAFGAGVITVAVISILQLQVCREERADS